MLIGLLLGRWGKRKPEAAAPRIPVSRSHPSRHGEVMRAIGETLTAFGYDALTDSERVIWNTALALSFLTGYRKEAFSPDARVYHWSAARIGFESMKVPDAADCVASLVTELAFRAELPLRGRSGEADSLLRLADLQHRFRRIEAENDLPAKFDAMIERSYPWND